MPIPTRDADLDKIYAAIGEVVTSPAPGGSHYQTNCKVHRNPLALLEQYGLAAITESGQVITLRTGSIPLANGQALTVAGEDWVVKRYTPIEDGHKTLVVCVKQ